MSKLPSTLLALWLSSVILTAAQVLIVADEIPAMRVLAAHLQTNAGMTSTIVVQTNMPRDLAPYAAVVVYIHRSLDPAAERAFIRYTEAGGKLIPLHHSISSGKRKNKDWFRFLGVSLPPGELSQGGYKWTEGVTLDFVSLAPAHFITTNRVVWPRQIPYQSDRAPGPASPRPGFTLQDTEVYLNHVLNAEQTPLLGLRYTEPASGQVYMQDRAGWIKRAGQGWIIYFQAGHSPADFQDPTYAQILVNAVVYKPGT